MILGKPAPFVSAFIDAVDEAIRAQSPSHGLSAMQRTWLAFCVTAVLVTNSICWARFARASLGTYRLSLIGSRALAAYDDVDGSSTANNRPWSRTCTARLLRRPDASARAHTV